MNLTQKIATGAVAVLLARAPAQTTQPTTKPFVSTIPKTQPASQPAPGTGSWKDLKRDLNEMLHPDYNLKITATPTAEDVGEIVAHASQAVGSVENPITACTSKDNMQELIESLKQRMSTPEEYTARAIFYGLSAPLVAYSLP